jgi:hypothetical protein
MATTQAQVVNAERTVSIAEFNAKAVVKAAEGEAQSKTINASADATVLRTVGDATLVPDIVAGGSDSSGGIVSVLIARMLSDSIAKKAT